METNKPFKGKLYHWYKQPFDVKENEGYYKESVGLGYIIVGYRTKEPKLGTYWQTSWVVKHKDGYVETRNSVYKLVGKESIKE